jgi:GTP cyclohydrolase II
MRIVDGIRDVPLRNERGEFLAGAYRTEHDGRFADHLLLYRRLDVRPLPVRLNSACFTSDLFGCSRCDCRWQLQFAIRYIAAHDAGLVIYHLDDEGRGNGLIAKLRAQDAMAREGLTSKAAYERLGVSADARDYAASAALLHHLGVREIALMSNSPHKRRCLEAAGIRVPTTVPVKSPDGSLEDFYAWKRTDFGHRV